MRLRQETGLKFSWVSIYMGHPLDILSSLGENHLPSVNPFQSNPTDLPRSCLLLVSSTHEVHKQNSSAQVFYSDTIYPIACSTWADITICGQYPNLQSGVTSTERKTSLVYQVGRTFPHWQHKAQLSHHIIQVSTINLHSSVWCCIAISRLLWSAPLLYWIYVFIV